MKKRNFREEYGKARFYDEVLEPKSIEEVIQHPKGTVVRSEEMDILIPLAEQDVSHLVSKVQTADREGPERWLHPVIIVKSEAQIPITSGFIAKDYASLSRTNAEFYSILLDETRKQRLLKRLESICHTLQGSGEAQLSRDSVLWFPSQINPEFNAYLNENQRGLDPRE